MRVVVGSTNRAKVEAARAVFGRAWPGCEVTGRRVELPADIPAMPVGDQVRAGARYRAQAVLGPGVDFGVGAEGGVYFAEDGAYLLNWCAVADAAGNVYDAPSPHVRLPASWTRALRAGAELGPFLAELTGEPDINEKGGAIGLLTRGLLNRQAFFEQALICALAPVLGREWYE